MSARRMSKHRTGSSPASVCRRALRSGRTRSRRRRASCRRPPAGRHRGGRRRARAGCPFRACRERDCKRARTRGRSGDGEGTQWGRRRDGGGTEQGRSGDGGGTEAGRRRDGAGTQWGRRRDGGGTEQGRSGDGGGTEWGRRRDAVGTEEGRSTVGTEEGRSRDGARTERAITPGTNRPPVISTRCRPLLSVVYHHVVHTRSREQVDLENDGHRPPVLGDGASSRRKHLAGMSEDRFGGIRVHSLELDGVVVG